MLALTALEGPDCLRQASDLHREGDESFRLWTMKASALQRKRATAALASLMAPHGMPGGQPLTPRGVRPAPPVQGNCASQTASPARVVQRHLRVTLRVRVIRRGRPVAQHARLVPGPAEDDVDFRAPRTLIACSRCLPHNA